MLLYIQIKMFKSSRKKRVTPRKSLKSFKRSKQKSFRKSRKNTKRLKKTIKNIKNQSLIDQEGDQNKF